MSSTHTLPDAGEEECPESHYPGVSWNNRSGRLGEANPKSHVDACVDRLNEGLWSPGVANTTPYLTGSVFTVAKVKRRKSEAVTCTCPIKIRLMLIKSISIPFSFMRAWSPAASNFSKSSCAVLFTCLMQMGGWHSSFNVK